MARSWANLESKHDPKQQRMPNFSRRTYSQYPEVKEVVRQRFKNNLVSDLAKALEIRLDSQGDVNEYYHRKLSLLDSTQLSVAQRRNQQQWSSSTVP